MPPTTRRRVSPHLSPAKQPPKPRNPQPAAPTKAPHTSPGDTLPHLFNQNRQPTQSAQNAQPPMPPTTRHRRVSPHISPAKALQRPDTPQFPPRPRTPAPVTRSPTSSTGTVAHPKRTEHTAPASIHPPPRLVSHIPRQSPAAPRSPLLPPRPRTPPPVTRSPSSSTGTVAHAKRSAPRLHPPVASSCPKYPPRSVPRFHPARHRIALAQSPDRQTAPRGRP